MNDLLKESRDELSAVSDKLFVEIYEQGYNAGLTARKENGCAFCDIGDAIRGLAERLRVPEVPVNQQRAELIRRARAFVEEQKTSITGEHYVYSYFRCNAEFIVNIEKRTIVCLLKGSEFPRIYSKGIAKCMPDDVFNADIGKAIALARALEIDISDEFTHAVQPTEKAIGMVVKYEGRYDVTLFPEGSICDYRNGTATIKSQVSKSSFIIDDTNAIYSDCDET